MAGRTSNRIGLPLTGGSQNAGVKGTSGGLVASAVIRDHAATLIHLRGVNTGADQYLQIFDLAAEPANGAVPYASWSIPTGNFYIEVPLCGEFFEKGIVVCNSSTAASKTIGSADLWLNWVVLG